MTFKNLFTVLILSSKSTELLQADPPLCLSIRYFPVMIMGKKVSK